jgi:hypothetical protein
VIHEAPRPRRVLRLLSIYASIQDNSAVLLAFHLGMKMHVDLERSKLYAEDHDPSYSHGERRRRSRLGDCGAAHHKCQPSKYEYSCPESQIIRSGRAARCDSRWSVAWRSRSSRNLGPSCEHPGISLHSVRSCEQDFLQYTLTELVYMNSSARLGGGNAAAPVDAAVVEAFCRDFDPEQARLAPHRGTRLE